MKNKLKIIAIVFNFGVGICLFILHFINIGVLDNKKTVFGIDINRNEKTDSDDYILPKADDFYEDAKNYLLQHSFEFTDEDMHWTLDFSPLTEKDQIKLDVTFYSYSKRGSANGLYILAYDNSIREEIVFKRISGNPQNTSISVDKNLNAVFIFENGIRVNLVKKNKNSSSSNSNTATDQYAWIIGEWAPNEEFYAEAEIISFDENGNFSSGDDCTIKGTYTIKENTVYLTGKIRCPEIDLNNNVYYSEEDYSHTITIQGNRLEGYRKFNYYSQETLNEPITQNRTQNENQVNGDAVYYYIIIGSWPNQNYANNALTEFHSKGFDDAGIIFQDNKYRVYINRFHNNNEADNYLKKFCSENPVYENAWVLKK